MSDEDKAVINSLESMSRRSVLRGIAGSALLASMNRAAAAHSDSKQYTTRELTIESWDGTELACTLYQPNPDHPKQTNGPYPSLLMTHGWGGDRSSATAPDMFATHGYVVLTYDSRGFGESGGEVNTNGPSEIRDAQWLITWLGKSNGQVDDNGFERPSVKNDRSPSEANPVVGMIGGSYAGGIQLNTAAYDDRLNAIVPLIPWFDLSFSLEPNDVVKSSWGVLLYGVGITGSRGVTSGDGQPSREDARNGLDSNLHEAHGAETVLNGFDDNTEAWYKERSVGPMLKFIDEWNTPTLTIQGWPDTLFIPNEGIWIHEGLFERDADSRLVLYNSGHTLDAGEGQGDAALRRGLSFLDEHLKNNPTDRVTQIGPTDRQPIEYFEVQGETADDPSSWTTVRTMPPKGAEQTNYSFTDAETIQSEQTVVVNSVAPTSASQVSPVNHDSPATSANFDFPITAATEVIGTPTIGAQVQLLGNATHLFWGFYHVRDGESTLINNQVMPFRLERDESALGEPVTVEGELVAFQRYLKPDDTLRLTVSTTDAGFNSARQSGGAVINHANSSVTLPFRDWDGNRN